MATEVDRISTSIPDRPQIGSAATPTEMRLIPITMPTEVEPTTIRRRPQIGCTLGDSVAPDQLLQEEAVGRLFMRAIDLLPTSEMPVLLKCVIGGGACFGLLDPVSNIILGAVSYLDRLQNPPPEELARRAAMTIQEQQCEDSRNRIRDHVDMEFVHKVGLSFSAGRSRKGLVVFLQNYFRYLTEEQAARYIELANFDLTVATMLVKYDRFASDSLNDIDPSTIRTQTALKQAAQEAMLWAPLDDFVLLATSRYPYDLLEKVTSRLLMRKKLSCSDISQILNLMKWRRQSDLAHPGGFLHDDDPNLAQLIVLQKPEEMETLMLSCLECCPMLSVPKAPSSQHSSSSSCCYYHRGLKLQLLDSIHVYYLDALARLPSDFLCKHLRGIMVGGYCFGAFDPVSNIIFNAIWYDMVFPLENEKGNEAADVLDNRCFLRMERRSLAGMVELFVKLCLARGEGDLFEHKALEYLCMNGCNISTYQERSNMETSIEYFISAASAARHPQYVVFGMFLGSLSPQVVAQCSQLLRCESGSNIHADKLHNVKNLLATLLQQNDTRWPARSLTSKAWMILLKRKKDFFVEQSFIRKMVGIVLSVYNSSHTEEPMYRLHAICGVAANNSCSGLTSFHVNFLARTDCEASGCMLFFSEFFGFRSFDDDSTVSFTRENLRPIFCCPVSRNDGRCCRCEKIGSKILHPASRRYLSSDGEDSACSFPILNSMNEDAIITDGPLELDFIYFDPKRDNQLALHLIELGMRQDSSSSTNNSTF